MQSTHLIIVPIGDGIGLDSSLFHLKQHFYSQDGLAILATQLQQHTVAHLGQVKQQGFNVKAIKYNLKHIHSNN